MTSYETMILFIISLPGIKALWFSEMSIVSIVFNLLSKTFEITLYATLHKDMGRKSIMLTGFFFLGIKTMFTSPIWFSSLPCMKKLRTRFTVLILMILQNYWYKLEVISSRPGDLSGCILKRAFFIHLVRPGPQGYHFVLDWFPLTQPLTLRFIPYLKQQTTS